MAASTAHSPTAKQTALLYLAGVRILLHRLWKKVFGTREPPAIEWFDSRVLCVGLDGAGKSSLVRRVSDPSAALDPAIKPTNGFCVRTADVPPDWKCEMWEVGGASAMRPFWPKYVTPATRGLVWVVDGSAEARLSDSGRALGELLRDAPRLRSLPILVLATKTDLPSALGEVAVSDGLGLAAMANQGLSSGPRKVVQVSAVDGRHLLESLRWLCEGGVDVVEGEQRT